MEAVLPGGLWASEDLEDTPQALFCVVLCWVALCCVAFCCIDDVVALSQTTRVKLLRFTLNTKLFIKLECIISVF